MAQTPWESIPDEDTLFVLITGANSGIGFGICQRLIDEFLSSRSLASHLVLIPTTRSKQKSQETINALRIYARRTAQKSKALSSRAGPDCSPATITRRIHLLSVQLDLCNFRSVKAAAEQLVSGTLSSLGPEDDGVVHLRDVRVPRLDAVILNAGFGGWTGLNVWGLIHNFLTKGMVHATTWPTFKVATAGRTINPLPAPSGSTPSKQTPVMGEVFCANVFGHYLFAHFLTPLLSRPTAQKSVSPGRIIWVSSLDTAWETLSLSDFQAIESGAPYESSKRLTDVLALTSDLPSVRPYSRPYLTTPSSSRSTRSSANGATPPRMYVTHPGIVVTTFFPLPWIIFFAYKAAMYLVRLLGSPWHVVTSYNGAVAPAWAALSSQAELDAVHAERANWGSSSTRGGVAAPKRTEVEGWGWEGRIEDAEALKAGGESGVLRKLVGRRYHAPDLTEERLQEFEELGVECWREMERLRIEWEARI